MVAVKSTEGHVADSWSHLRGKTALVDDSTKAQKRFTNAKNGGNGVPDHSPSDNGSAHNRDSGSVKGKHGTVKAETGLPDSNASAVPLRQFSTPQSKPAHTDRLRLLRKPPPPAVTSDAGIDAKLDATEAFVPPSAPLVKRRHAAITTSSHKPPSRRHSVENCVCRLGPNGVTFSRQHAPARPTTQHKPGHSADEYLSADALKRQLWSSKAFEYSAPDAAALKRQSELFSKMAQFQLLVRHIEKDGNCQFRAFSHQLYDDEDYHSQVRSRVVQQLYAAESHYSSFLTVRKFDHYCLTLCRPAEWGDHVSLQAACDSFNVKLVVLMPERTPPYQILMPHHDGASARRTLWLYFAQKHYMSVQVPDGIDETLLITTLCSG